MDDLMFFDLIGIEDGEFSIERFRAGEPIILDSPSGKYIAVKVVKNEDGSKVGFIAKPYVN